MIQSWACSYRAGTITTISITITISISITHGSYGAGADHTEAGGDHTGVWRAMAAEHGKLGQAVQGCGRPTQGTADHMAARGGRILLDHTGAADQGGPRWAKADQGGLFQQMAPPTRT